MGATSGNTIADTTYGRVRGARVDEGVLRFAGVPYAAPPTGERRFAAPVDPEPWDGVRDGREYGPACAQVIETPARSYIDPERMSEDCLHLNIWTPGLDGADRPVLVWIHGGGYLFGAGSDPRVDGTAFAQRGDVVLVTIQYRLGPLGGLYLAHAGDDEYALSHNNQTRDQRQALGWVRENIDAFGGDPGNVTVFGVSAGGTSVMSLVVSEGAPELVDKAVAQSGGLRRLRSIDRARAITDDFLATAGTSDAEGLVGFSEEEFMAVTEEFVRSRWDEKTNLFRPVRDGELIPEDPFGYIADGGTAEIPLMHGTTLHEFNWWTTRFPEETTAFTVERLRPRLVEQHGLTSADVDRMVEAVRTDHPGEDEAQVCYDVITQNRYRHDHRLIAAAREGAGESWVYVFGWESPVEPIRAAHTVEVPFVFHNHTSPVVREFIGEDPPRALADVVQDAWVAFARHGDPNHPGIPEWPVYSTTEYPVLEFNLPPRLHREFEPTIRATWDSIDLPTYAIPITIL